MFQWDVPDSTVKDTARIIRDFQVGNAMYPVKTLQVVIVGNPAILHKLDAAMPTGFTGRDLSFAYIATFVPDGSSKMILNIIFI
jgi:hypothetical protein